MSITVSWVSSAKLLVAEAPFVFLVIFASRIWIGNFFCCFLVEVLKYLESQSWINFLKARLGRYSTDEEAAPDPARISCLGGQADDFHELGSAFLVLDSEVYALFYSVWHKSSTFERKKKKIKKRVSQRLNICWYTSGTLSRESVHEVLNIW
jgi:hypothetical protein